MRDKKRQEEQEGQRERERERETERKRERMRRVWEEVKSTGSHSSLHGHTLQDCA